MGKVKPDPFRIIGDLITSAINTARIFGENRRISNLVAGSVARFMADMDEGDALLSHALGHISDDDEAYVPQLRASLQALSARRS